MSDIRFDDEPLRWIADPAEGIDLAVLMNIESERFGRTGRNLTALVAALGWLASVVGAVVGFGLAAAALCSLIH